MNSVFDIKFNEVKLNVAYDCEATQKTNETLILRHFLRSDFRTQSARVPTQMITYC